MDWSGGKILNLISMYRDRPMLWDPGHPMYKNFIKRYEAWEEISQQLDQLPVEELKKKMGSLMATFRKIRRQQVTKPEDEVTWFAYKSFSFMNRIYTPKIFIPAENFVDQWDDIYSREDSNSKLSLDEHHVLTDCNDPISEGDPIGSAIKSEEVDPSSGRKRRAGQWETEGDEELDPEHAEEEVSRNKKERRSSREQDCNGPPRQKLLHRSSYDCISFGRYLVDKLQTYSRKTRSAVQHAISEILFSADQGKFETSCEQRLQSQELPTVNNEVSEPDLTETSHESYDYLSHQSGSIKTEHCTVVIERL